MRIEKSHKAAFIVIGLKTNTTNANESNPETALIPGLWQQFFSENIESQIPNITDANTILGVYWDYEGENEKSYNLLAGREVSSLQDIPVEMTGIKVPESDYLVFSEEGDMPSVIYSLWDSVQGYFSENKNILRKYSYDFECYNTNNSSRVDIYISVKS